MKDEQLDAAIDRAVREMMDAEPRPGMRQRVFTRLEAQLEAPQRSMLTRPRLATAAAVLAAVLVLTFIIQPRERPTESTAQAGPAAAAIEPRAKPMDIDDRPRRAVQALPKVEARRSQEMQVQAASVETIEPPYATVQIQPMEPIEPIGFARLEPEPIAAGEIRINPLAIDAIEIATLTPPR